jgi:RND family efflux transporter MFP subunit
MNTSRLYRSVCHLLAVVSCLAFCTVARSQGVYEGFTEPRQDILVAATEIGRLESLAVKVGDRVTAGEVVGQLDDALQILALEMAEQGVQMHGERDAAEAEVNRSQTRVEQLRKLSQLGNARPDELARAETDLQVANARLTSALESQEMRSMELQRSELQLERRKVRAPWSGVISEVFHHPGEYVSPNDPAVVRLLVMDKMYAVVNVPVEDSLGMQVGATGEVHLRSSEVTIPATISSKAPVIDGESGTVEVRVELDNPDGKILAGDRCTLHFNVSAQDTPQQRTAQTPGLGTLQHNGGAKNR